MKKTIALAITVLALAGATSMASAQTASTVSVPTQRVRPATQNTVDPTATVQQSTVQVTDINQVQDTTQIAVSTPVPATPTPMPVSGSMSNTLVMMMAGLLLVASGAYFSLRHS